ncbi:hypothetical protein D3C78_1927190 [compost metagenome]
MPELFDGLPDALRSLVDNGIVAGSFTAIVMNLLFNGLGGKRKASMTEVKTDSSETAQATV